ncbi:MAG: cytochrome c biogenesis protein CcsA [bacterium]
MSQKWTVALAACCAALLGLATFLVVARVPNELVQGVIFKIFFFHVPAAWLMLLSALVCAGGAIVHLTGRPKGDAVAAAAGELAFAFGIIVMTTGPLWASRAWGKPWVWDARLTTSLVCWLTFAVYVFVRRFAGPEAPRLSAALAIFGAANVPLVYFSVKLWSRGMHPPTTVVQTLEPVMKHALFISLGAFTLLWILIFSVRVSQELAARELDASYARAESLERL